MKKRDDERYCGGTIFIDEASGFINLAYKVSLNISKTIEAKRKFEYIYIAVIRYSGFGVPRKE